mgnify:CR=1 FL=1
MNIRTLNRACMRAIVLMVLSLQAVAASELVYTPLNPSFGGNPNNGPVLLSVAQAQNSYKAPTLSPLENFSKNLQQSILNHIQSDIISNMFGNGALTAQTYDTGSYTVSVNPQPNGSVEITTTDKNSGATATFNVTAQLQ